MNKKSEYNIYYPAFVQPVRFLVFTVFFAAGIIGLSDPRSNLQFIHFVAEYYGALVLAGFLYVFYYILCFAPIKIKGDLLILPRTGLSGRPVWFGFKKLTIDIHSITRIINYQERFSLGLLMSEGPIASPDAKVSIFFKNNTRILLSSQFYGRAVLDQLIAAISARNDDLEIIDRN